MLSDTHIERYSRQVIVPQIGGRGQEKLLAASVVVVGAGGIGSAAALYLAAAGVGRLGIVDSAAVEASDLSSIVVHAAASVGTNRAHSVAAALATLNPDCRIEPRPELVTSDVAAAVTAGHGVVISAEAAFAVCCLLNAACLRLRKPLLWGHAVGFVGQFAVLSDPRPDAPCCRCLEPQRPELDGGAAPIIFTPAAGFIGTLLATEAIKRIVGVEDPSAARLVHYDGLEGSVQEVVVYRNPHCELCGVEQRTPGVHP